MKVAIFPIRRRIDVRGIVQIVSELPEEFYLFASSQYLNYLEEIKSMLENKGKKVLLTKLPHAAQEGHIVGCSIKKLDKPAVVISDGLFHGEALLFSNNIGNVFIVNPVSWTLTKIHKEKINKIKKRIEAMKKKYLESKNIGLIVSTKPGQNYMDLVLQVADQLQKKGKNPYIFLTNTLDLNRLIDYCFIDLWINTACPRILDDIIHTTIPLINLVDILPLIEDLPHEEKEK